MQVTVMTSCPLVDFRGGTNGKAYQIEDFFFKKST